MSNHTAYGTITGNTSTTEVTLSGWATMTAHYDAGTGTMTWQFKGVDGVWRDIYGGDDNLTLQAYTATHMVNAFFGTDTKIRGTVTGSAGLTLDWQIMSSPFNRND